jgi:hypothetical protein
MKVKEVKRRPVLITWWLQARVKHCVATGVCEHIGEFTRLANPC